MQDEHVLSDLPALQMEKPPGQHIDNHTWSDLSEPAALGSIDTYCEEISVGWQGCATEPTEADSDFELLASASACTGIQSEGQHREQPMSHQLLRHGSAGFRKLVKVIRGQSSRRVLSCIL